jgi:hypothetical protein
MKAKRLTKAAMAKRMGTTRVQVDRLLDPESPSTSRRGGATLKK